MKNQFKVCDKCFNDEELIGFITSFQQEGTCDFCKQKESMVINLDELQAFFQELIICFSPHKSGQPLIDIIQNNWLLPGEPTL